MFTLSHRFVEPGVGGGGTGAFVYVCVCICVLPDPNDAASTPPATPLPSSPGQGVIESVAVISVRGGSPAASLAVLHLPNQSQQSLGGHVQDGGRESQPPGWAITHLHAGPGPYLGLPLQASSSTALSWGREILRCPIA